MTANSATIEMLQQNLQPGFAPRMMTRRKRAFDRRACFFASAIYGGLYGPLRRAATLSAVVQTCTVCRLIRFAPVGDSDKRPDKEPPTMANTTPTPENRSAFSELGDYIDLFDAVDSKLQDMRSIVYALSEDDKNEHCRIFHWLDKELCKVLKLQDRQLEIVRGRCAS